MIELITCTVGTVQVLKKLLPTNAFFDSTRFKVVLTIIIGTLYSVLPIPEQVITAALVVSGSVLCYDAVLKNILNFAKSKGKGGDSFEITGTGEIDE